MLAALERHWGYTSFRPRQRAIVEALLAGRDVAAVMPTGGGKSLCYQLPAVASGRTAVVVSPLIALMRDQTVQLEQMGIPAAALNSSIDGSEQSLIRGRARNGAYRLLYVSPERLMQQGFIDWLGEVDPAYFAIDEAHCISEWGHEFRPEYRELRTLRQHFPDAPIAAFTASATQRVRHEMLALLGLQQPHLSIASFFRANLRYTVRESTAKEQDALLLSVLERHEGESVVVYAPSIKRVGETADFLRAAGVSAVAYHGRMDTGERGANQSAWMNDEVNVLDGTIAFGMGINKPDVRAVVHLSLPKSIEQYYQEAGRAGRDGEPADCVLLWRKADTALLAHFIGEVQDRDEKERAWQRYHVSKRFAESGAQPEHCRHRQICRHFGETPKWTECGACDVCLGAPDWLKAVKTPAKAVGVVAKVPVGAPPVDETVLVALRAWRLEVSKKYSVPAFMVMHDATLVALASHKPRTAAELRGIPGIGEKKAQVYGAQILAVLAN